MRYTLLIFSILLSASVTFAKPIEKSVNTMGFRGKLSLTQLPNDRIQIEVRTGHIRVTDTVRGHSLYPILVKGRPEPFYVGRFGASRYPMLVFGVADPDRIQDSRVVAYQVSPAGMLIGQHVIVDDALRHGHTEDVSGGRYQLASLDPQLGAIYSVSYQDARFDGYYVTYEKLRVRQWDAALNAFIEADQGFLREKNGKLVESMKFHTLSDRTRSQLFAANLQNLQARSRPKVRTASKLLPVSTMR